MGVLKFDGTNWTTYSPNITGISCSAIAIDKQGNKWIGTMAGVFKFDGVNWTNYTCDYPSLFSVNSIAIDSYGDKWFGTNNGVLKLQN